MSRPRSSDIPDHSLREPGRWMAQTHAKDNPVPTEERPEVGSPPPQLTRITVNLTPATLRDLDSLIVATGLNRTDLINRAVRLLALLHPRLEERTVALIQPDGRHERLIVL